jgi:hypothetical protein
VHDLAEYGVPQDRICLHLINPLTAQPIDAATLRREFRAELDAGNAAAEQRLAATAYQMASAPDLIALRFAIAGPVLLPVVIRRGLAIDRLGWPGFIAVVFGAGAPQVLVVGAGLLFAPVAHAGALYQGVVPLAVACLASVVLKERLTAVRKIGLSFVLIGAFMIGGIGVSSLGGRQTIGHLLFLAAAGMVAGYTVAIRRAHIDGLHAAAIAAVASLIFYLPVRPEPAEAGPTANRTGSLTRTTDPLPAARATAFLSHQPSILLDRGCSRKERPCTLPSEVTSPQRRGRSSPPATFSTPRSVPKVSPPALREASIGQPRPRGSCRLP